MRKYEKEEISALPDKYRPLGAWEYFGYTVLFSLPIVGLIFLIVFACSDGNINRRSFARSYFCGFVVCSILVILLAIAGVSILTTLLGYVESIGI